MATLVTIQARSWCNEPLSSRLAGLFSLERNKNRPVHREPPPPGRNASDT